MSRLLELQALDLERSEDLQCRNLLCEKVKLMKEFYFAIAKVSSVEFVSMDLDKY